MAGTSRDRPSLPGPNIWQVVGVHCLPSPTLPPAESVNPIVPKSFRAGGGQWREEETSAGQLSGVTETPRCTTVVIVRREECKSEGQKRSSVFLCLFFPLSKQNTLIPKQKLFTEMGRGLTARYIGTATREMELLVMSWAEDHGGEGEMWRVGRRH